MNDVIADGALYFSSAGNEGNTVDGTSGHWEGDFVNSGQVVGKFAGYAHDFDPGPGTQIFQPLSDATSAGAPVLLNWADPLGASNNDYDLYLLDSAGNVVASSQDVPDRHAGRLRARRHPERHRPADRDREVRGRRPVPVDVRAAWPVQGPGRR